MHDDIACIDQHPIALGKPIDRPCAVARFLEPAREMLGDGGHMTARASVGDDDGIGERRTALEVDRDDVLGLVVIQGFQDTGKKGLGRMLAWCGFLLFRLALCA